MKIDIKNIDGTYICTIRNNIGNLFYGFSANKEIAILNCKRKAFYVKKNK